MSLRSALIIGCAALLALAVPSFADETSEAAIISPAVAAPYAANAIDVAEIERRIDALMRRNGMVGLSVAIVQDGKIIHAQGYGETIAGSRKKVTADTVFRWASLSKSVAAATAVLLAKDGYFGLSSPVQAFAPSVSLPESERLITLEDLLSHRTGIVRNAYDTRVEDGRDPKVIRASLSELPYLCEPGTCHGYQNVLFDAVAEMTEVATGIPYKAVVNERIFEPLGMDSATTTLEGLSRSRSWAQPHSRSGRLINTVKPTYYRVPAAAGVNSSITDMAKWMLAHMDDVEPSLPLDVRADLMTPRVDTPRENRRMRYRYGALSGAQYGLGWRTYDLDGHKVVGHRGAVEGYRSAMLFDPALRTGIALMWNSGSSRPVGLQLEMFDQVYGSGKRDWMRIGSIEDE